jgi:UDP-N-acetylglucosamine--N-acetylmuramyl-(pentapeptide) pyrophosphoryl-undecaprenol N-acetylglucosamine transferase
MSLRILIAGGGTGGHIFPALAIAGAIKEQEPSSDILFVGATGKMEMEKVPQAGFSIVGLDIVGLDRSSLIKNVALPFKLIKSFWQVRNVLRQFRPDAVIGVGGYSSFPVLRYAQAKGIPTFLHESNAYAGKSNQLLAKRATIIFTGAIGLERFFPASKIVFTGNPVRAAICGMLPERAKALAHFGLTADRPTLLVMGGSLGARSINQAIDEGIEQLEQAGIQLIWQTGKSYAKWATTRIAQRKGCYTADFIKEIEMAYAAADVVIARAGAMTIAELAVVAKPVLFVPFPLAAEDHQRVNAEQLVNKQAALMVTDSAARISLVPEAVALCLDGARQRSLRQAIASFAVRDAAQRVATALLRKLKENT